MATVSSGQGVRNYVLDHMLHALDDTPAHDEPFSHFYVENVFPDDVYAEMMEQMPDPTAYKPLSVENYHNAAGVSTRDVMSLDEPHLRRFPRGNANFGRGSPRPLRRRNLRRPCSKSWRPISQPASACLARRFIRSFRSRSHRSFAIWMATKSPRIRTAGQRSSRCSSICLAIAHNSN